MDARGRPPGTRWYERIEPLGPAAAVSMLCGTLAALAQPQLPPTQLSVVLAGVAILVGLFRRALILPAALIVGFMLTAWHGQRAMDARLPVALEGIDLSLIGHVSGLPEAAPGRARFDFVVESGEGPAGTLAGRRLRLAWYAAQAMPEPGSRWALQLRLKRPRGSINPGGFDFERHALERRIAATGYVREHRDNRALSAGGGVHRLRQELSDAIAANVGMPRARFVQALAVGDTRALDERDWEVLRATGIAHLIAISGLHVGLVAGFGALVMAGLYRVVPAAGLHLPLPQAAAVGAFVAATGYTALAGFALPTVRTLLMIGVVLLAVWLRRRIHAWQSLALALIAVLLWDPLSLLGAGFWLSFLGVAWLLWCMPRESRRPAWRMLLSAQAVMSLSLLPLTVWFFGQASIAGPIANLVAVPWISFVVVPLALVGTGLALFSTGLGAPFLVAAGLLMEGFWIGMERIADLRGALVYLPAPDAIALALSLIGAFWLLLPRAVPAKALALILFVPLVWPRLDRPARGSVDLWLLDVGQGLSVLVRTREHALLYDAGPAFVGGLDMGEASVLPAMRALGITRLEAYVESHGDNDHAGGSGAILRAYAPARVLASDPGRDAADRCETGQAWHWDDVEFEMLHPPPHFPYLGNDSSCVLSIRIGETRILIPGDISELIEARLVREQSDVLRSHVLVVPHHGSRTSSSDAFLSAVDPGLALIGVGHRNRFGLPREDVLARYAARDVPIASTAAGGALALRIGPDGVGSVKSWRTATPRFWREQ